MQGKWYVKDRTHAIQGAGRASRRIEMAWRILEAVSYTIFVDNLPKTMTKS